jgi:hypothetical protein
MKSSRRARWAAVAPIVLAAGSALAQHQYYYFHEPKPLPLNTALVAVYSADPAANIDAALASAGLDPRSRTASVMPGWSTAAVPAARQNGAGVAAAVDALSKSPGVGMASPVFVGMDGGPMFLPPEVLVQFDAGLTPAQCEAKIAAQGMTVATRNWDAAVMGPNSYIARVTTTDGFQALARTNALAVTPGVLFAEPSMIFTGHHDVVIPNDPSFSSSWCLNNTGQSGGTPNADMDGPEAWDYTLGGGVIDLIIDVGVLPTHPDLNLRLPGFDATGQNGAGAPVNSCDNHGTWVAGCVSAIINNAQGSCGMAPGARSCSARTFISTVPCNGGWTSNAQWTVDSLNFGVGIGARVTNNSNGYGFTSSAIDTAYTNTHNNNGVVHFASAGNNGTGVIGYPASSPSVNAVAAIDRTGNRAGFSQFGPGLAFSAPGVSIFSTDRSGGYAFVDGTSFASPNASAVACLVISRNSGLSAGSVEDIMAHTCKRTGQNSCGYNTDAGWGLVDGLFAALSAVAPPNNACASATLVEHSGTFYGSNYFASTDGSATCGSTGSNDVWWVVTPGTSGTVFVDTHGSTFDTVLSVYSGGCGGAQVACNDDDSFGFCGENSSVSFAAVAGTTYAIRVAGYFTDGSRSGGVQLNVSLPTPANDNCPGSIAITGTSVSGNNTGATDNGDATCGFNTGNDVWFTFQAPTTGTYSLDTCGSNFDTVISVHSACPGTTGNQIVCDDDAGSNGSCPFTLQSYLTFAGVAGTTYTIRLSGYNEHSGSYVLNIGYPAPANNNCGGAAAIGLGTTTGVTLGATNDGSSTCPGNAAPDVWFNFTAGCTATLALNLCGSDYDTVVAIYTGTCSALTLVGCNDDGAATHCTEYLPSYLEVPVTAGTTYKIRVGGFGANAGHYSLDLSYLPPANDTCATAAVAVAGPNPFSTCNATFNGPAGSCRPTATAPDVWFRFTPTRSGTWNANTCDPATNYDTVLSAYSGTCGALTELVCNDDSCGLSSRIAFPVTAGTTYHVRVSGFNTASGSGILTVIPPCPVDMNGDGVVNVADYLAFLSLYAAADPRADINGNGVINVADYLAFLALYAAGC